MHELDISAERRQDPQAPITPEERSQMRQRLGALNWRATQTAPWLLATVSVLQGCVEDGVVSDLLSVNKLVRLNRKHQDQGIRFAPFDEEPVVITFTDASWATRRDGSSQGGQLTVLMGKSVLQGCKTVFHVLSWSSKRLKRVARSSTSAEAQMSANALDQHEFAKLFMLEMQSPGPLDLRKADEILSGVPSCLVCDAKNIYDGIMKIESSGLQMEERRTAIELLGIKERLRQANVCLRWVNGDQELADGLTKPWKHEGLIKALLNGSWRIVYDAAYQSARRVRAMWKAHENATHEALYVLWDLASEVSQQKIGTGED